MVAEEAEVAGPEGTAEVIVVHLVEGLATVGGPAAESPQQCGAAALRCRYPRHL